MCNTITIEKSMENKWKKEKRKEKADCHAGIELCDHPLVMIFNAGSDCSSAN